MTDQTDTPEEREAKLAQIHAELEENKKRMEYSIDIAKEIITRMACGEVMKAICEDVHMPHRNTVTKWAGKHADFRQALAIAREMGTHAMVDDTVHIADTELDPQRARNRIASRQWLAGMVNRKDYGAKVDITVNERPSLKQALEHASGNVSLPVRDQLQIEDAQVIDETSKFFGDPNDYESSEPIIPDLSVDDEDIFS